MKLFNNSGHVFTLSPDFINHSPKQFVYFDNKNDITLTRTQRELFNLFDNISQLFSVNNCVFFSINLITIKSNRSQVAHDIHIKALGSGQDAGDKSCAKAQTMAIKYAYLTSLAIATDDDPEADSHTDEVMFNKTSPISKTNNIKSADKLVCYDCGSPVSQKVADFSKSKFGKCLCMDCQKSQKSVA